MAINSTSKEQTTGKGKTAVTTKITTLSINCQECNKTFSISGEKVTRGQLWVEAVKSNGWTYESAAIQHCPEHTAKATRKANSAAKKAEAKEAKESKKADAVKAIAKQVAPKAAPATKTTKSGVKMTVGNKVAPKAAPQAVAFSGGQSIGKTAKSAKSSK